MIPDSGYIENFCMPDERTQKSKVDIRDDIGDGKGLSECSTAVSPTGI